jgi:16S rRNA (uracil1498-N3)-methyltransferase
MTSPRFFVPALAGRPEFLASGDDGTVALPEAASHHANRVLRLRAGDAVVLFDGAGREFPAVLLAAGAGSDKNLRVRILGEDAPDREARIAITVVQTLSAQDKIDWLVEKCVELGVRRLVLAPAERSVVRLDESRRERRLGRWRDIAVAACCQCGRNHLMAVVLADDLAAGLRQGRDGSTRSWILDPGASAALGDGVAPAVAGDVLACAVGPEGGFTAGEVALAESLGYARARLGPRILRTETAGLVAAAALLALSGEFAR